MLPTLACSSRKSARVLFFLFSFVALASFVTAQTDNWIGTSGKWSDPTQWDNGVPVTGDNIVISTATANSIDDLSLSISGLTLGNSADALTIPKGVALNDTGPISNAGILDILPGAVVNVESVTQIQAGVVSGGQWVLGSNLNITGEAQFVYANNATVTLSGGTIKNAGGSDAFVNTFSRNLGTFRIMNSAKLGLSVTLSNSGQLTVGQGSKLIFAAGYGYGQTAGKTINDGTMVSQIGIGGGTLLGAGSVSGDLIVGLVTGTHGTFSVGDAGKSAIAQVTGTYFMWPTGILSTGIGGTTVGTQYSQVKAGHATLAGKLAAPLLNGFIPTVGQKFTVVSAGPVTGKFTNTTIPINSSEHFAISYTTTKVVLTVVSGPAAE